MVNPVNSLTLELVLLVAQVFGWLFVVLPLFETTHHRFFQSTHSNLRASFRLADWYFAFFKALKQRPAIEARPFISYSRKGLLFVSLVLATMGISAIPLSSVIDWGGFNYFADNGSEIFSPFLLLGIIFCLNIVYLVFGFTFEKHFLPLSAVEKSATRQSAVLVIAAAMITTPFVEWDISLRQLVVSQMTPFVGAIPAWGALTNPIAFICACVAMTICLRLWQDDEFPGASVLRRSMQSELLGVELVTFRMARSLEYLLLYAMTVVVFLGGPYLNNSSIEPLLALTIFTAKIAILVLIIRGIDYLLPRIQQNQFLRVIFLVLLPLEVIGYPISLALCEILNFR